MGGGAKIAGVWEGGDGEVWSGGCHGVRALSCGLLLVTGSSRIDM